MRQLLSGTEECRMLPNLIRFQSRVFLAFVLVLMSAVLISTPAQAVTVDAFYAGAYTATNLGAVPGLPIPYGGLTLKAGDPDTLLIGGDANTAPGKIYSIGVTRDAGNHIIGFTGSATVYIDGAYNDGGVLYGPGGVLFLARWPVNELGETNAGSTITDKIIDFSTFGTFNTANDESLAALNFVPAGFPGAGRLKLVTWSEGQWFDAGVAPDGSGTYD